MAPAEPSKAIQQLQATPLDALEQQIARGQLSDELRTVLGDTLAGEVEQMTQTGTPALLGDEERPQVVVLPGIIGSSLMNTIGDVGTIWLNPLALLFGKFSLLRLDPSGKRDATRNVQIVASGLLPTHYLPMQIHLRVLGGCDVLAFPYDWRRTPDVAAESLRRLVQAQFQQTKRKVHLIGHSMGGLVARNFCLRYPDEARQTVAQIIQLGTPNYGSCEPIRTLTVGGDTAELAERINPANMPIEVMQTCPGLYAMLPVPQDLYPADAPLAYPYAGSLDAYDATAYASDGISATHLQTAREGYDWLAGAGESPVPLTIIAGYDVPTCLRVTHSAAGFAFATTQEGDGTVPLASATAVRGAARLYGRGLKHGDLPLYEVIRRAVSDMVHGNQPSGLEQAPFSTALGVEEAPTGVPEQPAAGTLGPPELDLIAERIRAGQATPEDLQALAAIR